MGERRSLTAYLMKPLNRNLAIAIFLLAGKSSNNFKAKTFPRKQLEANIKVCCYLKLTNDFNKLNSLNVTSFTEQLNACSSKTKVEISSAMVGESFGISFLFITIYESIPDCLVCVRPPTQACSLLLPNKKQR